MSKHSIFQYQRLFHAFRYSCQGLITAWKNEAAIRQELMIAFVMVPIAFWVSDSGVELALLLLSLGIIFLAELINTAIECTIDRIGEERHPLAGDAKDVGSAAVLFAIVLMVIVWAAVILY